MSTFEEIYRDTIQSSYYVASFILRDENLSTQVLKDSYLLAIRHMDMLENVDIKRQQDVMARIVSTKSLELIRTKDPVSYKAFYEADLSDLSYVDEEELSEWDVSTHSDLSYKKAASRVATAVKLLAQPQSASAFLHYYIGMGTIEIAAAMDVEEDVVKGHLAAGNRKLLKEGEDWRRQRRIPSDIDILPFLKWSLEREKDRNHYVGPNLLEELKKARLSNQDPRLVTRQEQSAEVYKEKKKEERLAKMHLPGKTEKESSKKEKVTSHSGKSHSSENSEGSDGASETKVLRIVIAAVIAAILLFFIGFRVLTGSSQNQNNASDQTRTEENVTEQVSTGDEEETSDTDTEEETDSNSAAENDAEEAEGETDSDNDENSEDTSEEESSEETEETAEETALDPLDDPDAYIIPDSDSRYLTAEEVEAMDWTHLYYAINELYARRGRIFGTTNKVQKYFDSKTWYNGTISPGNWSDTIFNEYERANLKLMMKYNGNS